VHPYSKGCGTPKVASCSKGGGDQKNSPSRLRFLSTIPREPSASAYGPRELLRTYSRLRCSVHEQPNPRTLGQTRPGPKRKHAFLAHSKLSTFPRFLRDAWGRSLWISGKGHPASVRNPPLIGPRAEARGGRSISPAFHKHVLFVQTRKNTQTGWFRSVGPVARQALRGERRPDILLISGRPCDSWSTRRRKRGKTSCSPRA